MVSGNKAGLVKYPGAGCVVEFMQGNSPQIAWVMEEQAGKLRLPLPNRRGKKPAPREKQQKSPPPETGGQKSRPCPAPKLP